jgi:hypothetical protein
MSPIELKSKQFEVIDTVEAIEFYYAKGCQEVYKMEGLSIPLRSMTR